MTPDASPSTSPPDQRAPAIAPSAADAPLPAAAEEATPPAELAFGFSRDQLYKVVDALNDGVIIIDRNGNLIDWNPAAVRLHGYASLDEVRRHLSTFTVNFLLWHVEGGPPIPIDQWPASRALRGEVLAGTELRVRRLDIDREWILSYDSTWIHVVPGDPSRDLLLLTIRDLTVRRQAEQTRATLAAIVEHSDDAIVGGTLDGIVTNWNRSAQRLYGYSAAEMIGQSIQRIVPPDRLDELSFILGRVRVGQSVVRVTTERVRRDGTMVDIALTVSPVRDGTGRIIGVSEIARDVTLERQNDASLRASEERFRRLADAMPQIVFISTPDGRVTYQNSRWTESTGLTVATRELAEQVIHPEDLPGALAASDEGRRRGQAYTSEFRLRHIDGGPYRSYYTRALPIRNDAGEIVEYFGTVTDVEDLKRAEFAARERQNELAHLERVRTMGQMAAGLAHELNQPLGAIANYAKACELATAGEMCDAAKLREMLAEVRSEALRAGEIVHRLRSFVRKQQPRGESVDAAALVAEAVRLLSYDLRSAGVRPQITRDAVLPAILADRVQIGQVLVNLLRNALDAMVSVPIEKRLLAIHIGAAPEGVCVTVTDSGCGIPADVLPNIFDAFFTTKPEGLGIGLNLCRTIIEDHGGRISARARGDGLPSTIFELLLKPAPSSDMARKD